MVDKEKKRKQKFKEQHEKTLEKAKLKDIINKQIISKQPKTIGDLVLDLEANFEKPREEIIPILREMEYNDELTLQEPLPEPTEPPKRVIDYFFANNYFSYEHWMVLTSIILALTLVLVNVTSGFFFYIRYIVVCFYMLILPGWVLTAAIFPELDDNLRFLERVATAIGLSIVILVIVGLFLNYTFRFNPVSIVLTLTIFIFVCQIIATGLRIKLARDGFIFKEKKEEIEFTEGG